MAALTIDRLALRYRIPVAQRDRERDLERVREQVFGHALEAALEAEGVGVHEVVAVRELSVPIRVEASLTMSAIVERWSSLLSEAIAGRIRHGDPREVARYRSRAAALVDLGRCVARADLRRGWVFVTLGLVTADAIEDVTPLREAFVVALRREPEAIVAVLVELARTPSLLARLAATLGERAWQGWALEALRVHAVPSEVRERLRAALESNSRGPAVTRREGERERAGEPHREGARRSLERDRVEALWVALARSPVLAAVAPELISGIASLLGERDSSPTIARLLARAARRDPSVLDRIALAILAEAPATAAMRLTTLAELLSWASPHAAGQREGEGEGHHVERTATPSGAPSQRSGEAVAAREAEAARDAETSEPESAADRRRVLDPWSDLESPIELASTRWGGLLLLIPIVRDLDLWTAMTELGERFGLELRAVLHRFAHLLIATELADDDPGLLAFVGLPPNAEVPAVEVTSELDDALGLVRAQVVEALDARLGSLQPRRGEGLLRWVLERRAVVVADPGWIELRFDARDVDTAIRRAGLDLDPDWLPTLGVVLKFTYA